MSRFIVASKQRSGTGFLETLLNAHPNIFCTGELLLPDRGDSFPRLWLEAIRKEDKYLVHKHAANLFRQYFNRFYAAHDEPHVGYDIKYDQFNTLAKLEDLLAEYSVKMIHLIRRNYLKTYISLLVNIEKQSRGRKAHDLKKYDPIRIRINTDERLHNELAKRKREIEYFAEFLPKHFETLTLYYEDFFDNSEESQTMKPEVLHSIFSFLGEGRERYDLESPIRKTNPSRIEDIIVNYDELVSSLAGTEFEGLLDKEKPQAVQASNDALMERAQILFTQGDISGAEKVFMSMFRLDTANADIANNLGVCRWKLGDFSHAKEWIVKAIQLDPSRNDFRENLYQLERMQR